MFSSRIFKIIVYVSCFMMIPSSLFPITQQEFSTWWQTFRQSPAVPEDLKMMVDYFVNSPSFEFTSKHWHYRNKQNIEQIVAHGYSNFKQTVALNYFTWLVTKEDPYARNLKDRIGNIASICNSIPISINELHRKHAFFTPEQSLEFNAITIAFLSYMLDHGWQEDLSRLEEPLIGNPPYVMFENRPVSQDLFNSLLELGCIRNASQPYPIQTIFEIGAGYGRTAYCFLKLFPNIKYIIVDFPPALLISQNYLSQVFPDKKIRKFHPFHSFQEIEQAFLESDILFITPDQLLLFPDNSGSHFLAIDCLHEMKPDQISFYFEQAQRLCQFFYLKCWKETVVPFDGFFYSMNSYQGPSQWKLLYEKDCFAHPHMFERVYKMK